MAGYQVIRDVGQSIVQFLLDELLADSQTNGIITNSSHVSQRSPREITQGSPGALLSVYLYRITENSYLKNQFPVSGNGGASRRPPLALDLNYMITPLNDDPTERQIILGKVMQLLYDRATLEGDDLVLPLSLAGEPVRIVWNAVSLEEMALVWDAMEMDYKLSVCYVARVTLVDSRRERFEQRILSRDSAYGAKP